MFYFSSKGDNVLGCVVTLEVPLEPHAGRETWPPHGSALPAYPGGCSWLGGCVRDRGSPGAPGLECSPSLTVAQLLPTELLRGSDSEAVVWAHAGHALTHLWA